MVPGGWWGAAHGGVIRACVARPVVSPQEDVSSVERAGSESSLGSRSCRARHCRKEAGTQEMLLEATWKS